MVSSTHGGPRSIRQSSLLIVFINSPLSSVISFLFSSTALSLVGVQSVFTRLYSQPSPPPPPPPPPEVCDWTRILFD